MLAEYGVFGVALEVLWIGRVTVAYGCLKLDTNACGGLRLPNLAIMYLVAHYIRTEHSASSASIITWPIPVAARNKRTRRRYQCLTFGELLGGFPWSSRRAHSL